MKEKGKSGRSFLDLFAGIGGFRLGLERAGFVCRGHCEIDAYANKSYLAMHTPREDEVYYQDITKISANTLPTVDVWTAGTPCQNFSLSGNRKGLDGTQSGLLFEFVRLLRETDHRPPWIILENVKGVFSANNGFDFGIILHELATLGYGLEYALCNSKDFGVPQNRERVYIIGDITGRSTGKIFPIGRTNKASIVKVAGERQGDRIYAGSGIAPTQTATTGEFGGKTGLYLVKKSGEQGLVFPEVAGTIDANYSKGILANQGRTGVFHSRLPRAVINPSKESVSQNGRRIKLEEEEMFTLMASGVHGILKDSRIRRLTPLECFRLQGFPDHYFHRAAMVCSDTQLYKQAGNAVTVPVVRAIAEKIMDYIKL